MQIHLPLKNSELLVHMCRRQRGGEEITPDRSNTQQTVLIEQYLCTVFVFSVQHCDVNPNLKTLVKILYVSEILPKTHWDHVESRNLLA